MFLFGHPVAVQKVFPKWDCWTLKGTTGEFGDVFKNVNMFCLLHTIFVHAEANIMYLGLNCTHCTGPVWSAFNTQTLNPVSAFQTWILPSVEPTRKNIYLETITGSQQGVCKTFLENFPDISLTFKQKFP